MSDHLEKRLLDLSQPEHLVQLRAIGRGIEKESLRIDRDGHLSQRPHPLALGSALTHSSITTDYSEALMEFITPVSESIETSLDTLADVHRFVYQKLDDELLWAASMPCIVEGDDGIPVARYGSSNVARMKTVYRYGLGHRYGRLMQAIAGIHYNFSLPEAFWRREWVQAGEPARMNTYISERYLDLIRNFRRHSWLLVYLYGASPAVCASFLRGRERHGLEAFDEGSRSLHKRWGTSLRMGDLGYNSDAQKALDICYNCLDSYIETLRSAIMQPHPGYARFKCGQDGEYEQLSDSLLQIENEFYSPIRPKRVTRSGETPLSALRRGGIEYIEVRCVDVSPFSPVGIDAQQIRFMDTFLLYCLLAESPACDDDVQAMQADNLSAIVNRGREPGLVLRTPDGEQPMTEVATQLLDGMTGIAALLDRAHDSHSYGEALADQRAKVVNPELTPSARVLREMRERDLPFFRLAMGYSEQWAEQFRASTLEPDVQERLEEETRRSLAAQRETEAADTITFEEYLRRFYAQYQEL